MFYAGLHLINNSRQEYRLLFEEAIEGARGIDVVDCPPGVGSPFFCNAPAAGESKAYLLHKALDEERRARGHGGRVRGG